MSGASRLGLDSAGGLVLTGSDNVFINGSPSARIGDTIEGHGNGEHSNPVIVTGSSTVFVNGIPMSKAGDVASCGDALTGSDNVFVGVWWRFSKNWLGKLGML